MHLHTFFSTKRENWEKKKQSVEERIIFQFPVKRNTLKNKIMKEDIMGYLVHIGYSQVRMNNTLLTDVYCLCVNSPTHSQKKSYARYLFCNLGYRENWTQPGPKFRKKFGQNSDKHSFVIYS